jgi:hypothetical protein
MTSPTRIEQFLSRVAQWGAQRAHTPDWRLRDRLLADFDRDIPICTPQEREQVRAAIDRACGVSQ